jgi:hypothetical protein
VFGVWYFVFGMKYMPLYRHVRVLNTKHQIQNTSLKILLLCVFTRLPKLIIKIAKRKQHFSLLPDHDKLIVVKKITFTRMSDYLQLSF